MKTEASVCYEMAIIFTLKFLSLDVIFTLHRHSFSILIQQIMNKAKYCTIKYLQGHISCHQQCNYEMRKIYPAFEWNFPFLACTHLIILNLHEHDNEFKSHAAPRSCCGRRWCSCARMAWLHQKFTEPKNVIKSCF